ncbi:MAG: hypothetical protein M3439_00450 [Chloroflexota bacterium]|nr:hypothetical protein [Chloroflexota bacterium]
MNARRDDDTLARAGRAMSVARDRQSATLPGVIEDAIGDEIGRTRAVEKPPAAARPRLDSPTSRRSKIRRQLNSREALRQAMIIVEILGPPKALRRSE